MLSKPKDNTTYTSIVSISTSSSLLPVISGVPQGSVLGPLLFLIYVNDIPSIALNSSIYMFADDTKFSKSISQFNDSAQLQSDINSLANWCHQWGLSLNSQKCACLRFSLNPNCPSPSYTINGVNIAVVVDQRDLGVTASHDLSWRTHYSKTLLQSIPYIGVRMTCTLGGGSFNIMCNSCAV